MSFEGRITAAVDQPRTALGSPRPLWALAGAIVLLSVAVQVQLGLDADVSWLLTVGERVLDGGRLYVDIFEVNPPASVLIYLPGLLLARGLHVAPELATAGLMFLLAGAAIAGAGRVLWRAGLLKPQQMPAAACAAIFAFVLLPGACFAQREHVAVVALLPLMAVLAARIERRPVSFAASLAAGVAAGIAVAIKPHFALAILPMTLFAMARLRSPRVAFCIENWAAAAVVAAYGLIVVIFYPLYVSDALPLLRAVYLPARGGFRELWLSPPSLLALTTIAMAVYVARGRIVRTEVALPLFAALGFAAAMGLQGKGYLNHWYPSLALAFFVLAFVLASEAIPHLGRKVGGAAFLLLAAVAGMLVTSAKTYPQLARVVRTVARPHPTVIVAASNLSVGHPLTRWVGGQWVGRRGALWATGAATALLDQERDPQRRDALQRYIDDDRRIFVEDVVRAKPAVLLVVGSTGREWIASNRDVAAALAPYAKRATAENVDVLVRRN